MSSERVWLVEAVIAAAREIADSAPTWWDGHIGKERCNYCENIDGNHSGGCEITDLQAALAALDAQHE